MAIPAVNLTLAPGSTSGASGQVYSQGGVSGFQSKEIYLLGTATLDGSTTNFAVNFIDGTQKLFQNLFVVNALNVTAPATINGVANQSVISGVGAFGALAVGNSVVVAGFANAGNNGTFTVNVVTTSSITVTNSSAVAESNNPSATVTFNKGSHVQACFAARAQYNAAGTIDTAANTISVTTINTVTDATANIVISAAGSAAQLLSVLVKAIPNS
jgi:hypothetical protein